MIRLLARKLYVGWVLFVFTFFMLLYLPGILLPFFWGERYGNISYRFLKLWAWTFSKFNRIIYHIHGRENIHSHKAYIYLSNHTSFLDIPGVCLTVPSQIRPLAKKELLKIPVFGWIVRHASVIVDRSSNESRKKSMEHMKDVLRRGISVLIFPEGTQNRTDKPLQPFFDGAFRIAIETQQPILPMVILGAGTLMPPRKGVIYPGAIKIIILEEIPTAGLLQKDLGDLKEKVMKRMMDVIVAENPDKYRS